MIAENLWMTPGLLALGGAAWRWTAMERRARKLDGEVTRLRDQTVDTVTDLPNRAVWESLACARISAEPERTALVLIDLNEFKTINDHFGHLAGDAVLRAVAQRLLAMVADHEGLVGRLGGDEFGVIASGLAGPDAVDAIANRIQEPVSLDGKTVRVTGAAGVVQCVDLTSPPTLNEALRIADSRLYQAKRRDQNRGVGDPRNPPHKPVFAA